jgi:hypothetical protein
MAEIEWQTTPVWDWRRIEAAGGTPAGAHPQGAQGARQAAAARRQGAIGGAVGLVVAATLAFLLHRRGAAMVVGALSVLIALLALATPLTLYRRLRDVLDRLGHWVATAVTWMLMTVLFFLLFLPVGLVMRATGKLTFTRFADPSLGTYWTATDQRLRTADSYRKQF